MTPRLSLTLTDRSPCSMVIGYCRCSRRRLWSPGRCGACGPGLSLNIAGHDDAGVIAFDENAPFALPNCDVFTLGLPDQPCDLFGQRRAGGKNIFQLNFERGLVFLIVRRECDLFG